MNRSKSISVLYQIQEQIQDTRMGFQSRFRQGRASSSGIGAKVAYVKSQGQTRNHHCHWPGCNKDVPPAVWGCRAHWYKLPEVIRDKIWNAFRAGQEKDMRPSRDYVAAAQEAQAWIAANYPSTPAETPAQGFLL